MTKITIDLDTEQDKKLKHKIVDLDIPSKAEYIKLLVEKDLAKDDVK